MFVILGWLVGEKRERKEMPARKNECTQYESEEDCDLISSVVLIVSVGSERRNYENTSVDTFVKVKEGGM